MVKDYDEEGKPSKATGQLIKIMDVQKLGLSDCGGDLAAYFNRWVLVGKNYPDRLDKIIIVNVPAAFGMIWRIVAPVGTLVMI